MTTIKILEYASVRLETPGNKSDYIRSMNDILKKDFTAGFYSFHNQAPNNRFQGTLHKVSGPLNRDVGT